MGRNVGWKRPRPTMCSRKAERGHEGVFKPQPTMREAPVLLETRSASAPDSLQAGWLGAAHKKCGLNTSTRAQQLGPRSVWVPVCRGCPTAATPPLSRHLTRAQRALVLSPHPQSLHAEHRRNSAQRYFRTPTLEKQYSPLGYTAKLHMPWVPTLKCTRVGMHADLLMCACVNEYA